MRKLTLALFFFKTSDLGKGSNDIRVAHAAVGHFENGFKKLMKIEYELV